MANISKQKGISKNNARNDIPTVQQLIDSIMSEAEQIMTQRFANMLGNSN